MRYLGLLEVSVIKFWTGESVLLSCHVAADWPWRSVITAAAVDWGGDGCGFMLSPFRTTAAAATKWTSSDGGEDGWSPHGSHHNGGVWGWEVSSVDCKGLPSVLVAIGLFTLVNGGGGLGRFLPTECCWAEQLWWGCGNTVQWRWASSGWG